MNENIVIGIDFGTSNTLCCYVDTTGENNERPIPILVDGSESTSFPTVLLYRRSLDGVWEPIAFGRQAADEWSLTPAEERPNYRYAANFKPDIAASSEARQHATVFLKQIARHLFDSNKLHGVRFDPHQQVVFGIPATPIKDHAKVTIEVAKAAGFARVETVEEPVAAFAHHLYARDVELQHVRSGVLVVDFGGGTCDFAYVASGKCQHAWGNPLYGGRLFDDLFYQWLCDTNPGVLKILERNDTDEAFVHWHCCRKAKEAFSKRMARDRDAKFYYADFAGNGSLRGLTWDEFRERSRRYSPSSQFQKMQAHGGRAYSEHFGAGPVDLVQHFQSSLRKGITQTNIDFVILAGGSSLWPFVTDVLIDEWPLVKDKIKQSANPQETISMGAALIPKLRRMISNTKQRLEEEAPDKKKKLVRRYDELSARLSERLGKELADSFVADHIEPLFNELREIDAVWSIHDLEQRIDQEVLAFQPKAKIIAERQMAEFLSLVTADVTDVIHAWLSAHHLRWEFRREEKLTVADLAIQMDKIDAADPVLFAVAATVSLTLAIVVANIAGGAGLHLIMAGPIGWIIGLVIGLVIATLALSYGIDEARRMAKSWLIPKMFRSAILTAGLPNKLRGKICDEIKKRLHEELDKQHGHTEKAIDDLITNLIGELDWVNATMWSS